MRARAKVRIIAGAWRGRTLAFPPLEGVRPTPNRVRETLFNWLAPTIGNACCLDAFAGSGALGFEALSRGASRVFFVDNQAKIAAYLREQSRVFAAQDRAMVHCGQVLSWLRAGRERHAAPPFSLIFCDPPFQHPLHLELCQALEAGDWLAPETKLYTENATPVALPEPWTCWRSKKAGDVCYQVFVRE